MLNWGVMSAGGIAYVFCNGMRFTDTGQVLAVASRTQSKADRLVNDFGIPRQYGNYEALLEDEKIDAMMLSIFQPSTRFMQSGRLSLLRPKSTFWLKTSDERASFTTSQSATNTAFRRCINDRERISANCWRSA